MNDTQPSGEHQSRRSIRWWPAVLILLIATSAILWARAREDWPYQQRNLTTAVIVMVSSIVLLVWWTFFSRAGTRLRLSVTGGVVGVAIVLAALFRLQGVTGDLSPIVAFRWAGRPAPAVALTNAVVTGQQSLEVSNNFPQFLGPDRNGVLPGPRLETNWAGHPPAMLWRQRIGAGWSGFSIVGNRALTQEQRGEDECVVCYELATGKPLWQHSDKLRYHTTMAGEGPRATPAVVSNRVFALGATGLLNCLDLATGERLWSRDLLQDPGARTPAWGCASSPLCLDELVVVHGAENAAYSLGAFRALDGEPVWKAGARASYASPIDAALAGVRQVVAFNDGSVSGHDLSSGATLWEKPWGNGNVVCSTPVVVSSNRVLFSSGYGVGAELLEISPAAGSRLAVRTVWKSARMKAKFAHLFLRDGCVFGLDDGMFACVDLADGSLKWKEGRYGHGQGLLVGELYLLMAESGELVLLRPTSAAPNELARFRVFPTKTWNPIALAGDLLLVRNDAEAACLRLATVP